MLDYTQRIQAIRDGVGKQDSRQLLDEISALIADVRNNRDKIPAHDLEKYEKELSLWSEKCREKPKKFAFKSKLARPAANAQVSQAPEQTQTPRQSRKVVEPANDLDHCIVMCDVPQKTLHLSKISNSVIFLQVDGPLYLTNIENTTIVAQCHQFRMHKSTECDVFLGTKRPIIEDCRAIRFGPAYFGSPWDEIDDFNWIRETQSINWSRIDTLPDFEWIDTPEGRAKWLEK
ncbi:Tubulin-specific chaperone C [Wickerhamiella sorbophila]|uniref:Tubulin-specific chaperone C n=1 Tax=Wickerhamiella sorbophila TaxID=45607 RepID=A0A2T0FE98_9ASCO|nr:Tubulin-specific chaperone C [Wickerhamiella sorbophila]PRT53287.1 Tubulin-specific chaperone C [Wickerhamiella sorbophila]